VPQNKCIKYEELYFMFIPPGFSQKSVVTHLGRMVYYTNDGEFWNTNSIAQQNERIPSNKLIFLHAFGGGSSAYEWSKVYPAFATEYQVLAPDLVGWGRSEHPAINYQVDDYVASIIDFIEQTHSQQSTVVASGLTAAFTIRAAITRPDLFKSLILVTPAGLKEFGEDYSTSFFASIVKVPFVDRLLYTTGIATSQGIRTFLEQRQFARAERVYPEIVDAYLESAQQPNAEYAALSFVRGDLAFDLSQYITQLSVPTAIIWGQKTEFTKPELGRRLAAMNPQAISIFQQLDDVGLTPQLELPGVTVGLIRKFIPMLERQPVAV
jgi:pimeloyl-ACP methyl ester carboxylesterase